VITRHTHELESAERQLREFVEARLGDRALDVKHHVRMGDVVATVFQLALDYDAEVIVVAAETAAAVAGASTTPGAGHAPIVIDMGGGTVDLHVELAGHTRAVAAAGAGVRKLKPVEEAAAAGTADAGATVVAACVAVTNEKPDGGGADAAGAAAAASTFAASSRFATGKSPIKSPKASIVVCSRAERSMQWSLLFPWGLRRDQGARDVRFGTPNAFFF
jgi:hypothetical protein